MKLYIIKLLLLLTFFVSICKSDKHGAIVEDNEFAEFEEEMDENVDFLDEENEEDAAKFESSNKKSVVEDNQDVTEFDDDDDATVETEGEDYATLDPDEFEGLDDIDDTIWDTEEDEESVKARKSSKKSSKKPELKIANVPLNVRSWDKYFSEILALIGILVYLMNFLHGKLRNNSLASAWLKSHLNYLISQFELVGDDPLQKKPESTEQLTKETEHLYNLWCSGRANISGMFVELKFLKRQDMISLISNYVVPVKDQVMLSITLESMDSFVFACGNKKSVTKLQKNLEDISLYCTDKVKPGDKYGLPDQMAVISEQWGELVGAILDSKVKQVINQYSDLFDTMHISDQYSGAKPYSQDDQPTKAPETECKLNFTFNFPSDAAAQPNAVEKLLPLMKMAIYMADKITKYRLSRENKAKADKTRQKVSMTYLKQTHLQRQEAAQLKKEEKNRAMKDRIMNEENPEKQRKLEEQQHRRDLKKKEKKNKNRQIKVKTM